MEGIRLALALSRAARADAAGVGNIRWVRALAEQIGSLDLGTFRLVTFGQSFHWTDEATVAEIVYDLLEPGGALALVVHTVENRPAPSKHTPAQAPYMIEKPYTWASSPVASPPRANPMSPPQVSAPTARLRRRGSMKLQ